MTSIAFETYVVDSANYHFNPQFENKDEKLHMPVEFSAEVGVDKDQQRAYVVIDVELGSTSDEEELLNVPFSCQVSIRGLFTYFDSEQSEEELKSILGINAVAILYPYVRSYISNLVNLSNQFPAYTLPVMNFAEMLKDSDLVNFVGFD